jgi:hypothetical protein
LQGFLSGLAFEAAQDGDFAFVIADTIAFAV